MQTKLVSNRLQRPLVVTSTTPTDQGRGVGISLAKMQKLKFKSAAASLLAQRGNLFGTKKTLCTLGGSFYPEQFSLG